MTLEDYNIKARAVINIVDESFPIVIRAQKIRKQKIRLRARNDMRISEVKKKLLGDYGVNWEESDLTFRDESLVNDRTLQSYKIEPNSVLYVEDLVCFCGFKFSILCQKRLKCAKIDLLFSKVSKILFVIDSSNQY